MGTRHPAIVRFAPRSPVLEADRGEEVEAVVEQRQAPRRGRLLGGVRPTSEDHRATTFELLFDLVFVVVAVQAQRGAEGAVGLGVAGEAGESCTV